MHPSNTLKVVMFVCACVLFLKFHTFLKLQFLHHSYIFTLSPFLISQRIRGTSRDALEVDQDSLRRRSKEEKS